MAKEPISGQEKRLETLRTKTDKKKLALLRELRKMPIIQVACARIGIGRATYYDWRVNDPGFARAADRAVGYGNALVNDVAESKLIEMIQERSLSAISLWLRHKHPDYANRDGFVSKFETAMPNKSVEEEETQSRLLSDEVARRMLRMKAWDESGDDEEDERETERRERQRYFEDRLKE